MTNITNGQNDVKTIDRLRALVREYESRRTAAYQEQATFELAEWDDKFDSALACYLTPEVRSLFTMQRVYEYVPFERWPRGSPVIENGHMILTVAGLPEDVTVAFAVHRGEASLNFYDDRIPQIAVYRAAGCDAQEGQLLSFARLILAEVDRQLGERA